MNSVEYENLSRVEREHWFYRGKRDIVLHWINRFIKLAPSDLLIDAGMGTGSWAVQMSSHCRVLGIDDHAESLALARSRLASVGAEAMSSSLTDVDLPSGCATVITMMDVLEHISEDGKALREMIRLTRPGGLLVLTVPALPWLWSDWDEAVQHRRRYTKSLLCRLMDQPGVRVMHCAYFNTAMLLPIALLRCYHRICPRKDASNRLEDWVPAAPLNRLLHALMVRPACCSFFPALSGVSLLGVMRKA